MTAPNIDPRAAELGLVYDQARDAHLASCSVVIEKARELQRVLDDKATRLIGSAVQAVRDAAYAERVASARLSAAIQELVGLADEADDVAITTPNLKETSL